MSGRSAYVRKHKSKVGVVKPHPFDQERTRQASIDAVPKTANSSQHSGGSGVDSTSMDAHLNRFPSFPATPGMYAGGGGGFHINKDLTPVVTGLSSSSAEPCYVKVHKTEDPRLYAPTAIVKSNTRINIEKRTGQFKSGMGKIFLGKKKSKSNSDETRSPTAAGMSTIFGHEELDPDFTSNPMYDTTHPSEERHVQMESPKSPAPLRDPVLPPPQTELPALPLEGKMLRWISGRPGQKWNKLRKDPELWDQEGDLLVFLHREHETDVQPSFRLWSQTVELSESKFLLALLRVGEVKDNSDQESHSGSASLRSGRPNFPAGRRQLPTPPVSDPGKPRYDSAVTYTLHFPEEYADSKEEIIRQQMTTRNVFALLCERQSLVGFDFYQALMDLQERMEIYWSIDEGDDPVGKIINWLMVTGLDDCRNDVAKAAAILRWSEEPDVNCPDLWRESYVHLVGMYDTMILKAELKRLILPMTSQSIKGASNDLAVRVEECAERLATFDVSSIWPRVSATSSQARGAFDRIQGFFTEYYTKLYGKWPIDKKDGNATWITRTLIKELEGDFGALYNYLVNRDVGWYYNEEELEYTMVSSTRKAVKADSDDLPMTDAIIKWDDYNRYPHIPCPFPLVPQADLKANEVRSRTLVERKAALAYSESTNMRLMASNFVPNAMVVEFLEFETKDYITQIDPFSARRGRWLAIYAILQTLASVAVDATYMRFADGVEYFLGCPFGWTPFDEQEIEPKKFQADHSHSICWTIRNSWKLTPPETVHKRVHVSPSIGSGSNGTVSTLYAGSLRPSRNVSPSVHSTAVSESVSSMRSPTLTNVSARSQQNYSKQLKVAEGMVSNANLDFAWSDNEKKSQRLAYTYEEEDEAETRTINAAAKPAPSIQDLRGRRALQLQQQAQQEYVGNGLAFRTQDRDPRENTPAPGARIIQEKNSQYLTPSAGRRENLTISTAQRDSDGSTTNSDEVFMTPSGQDLPFQTNSNLPRQDSMERQYLQAQQRPAPTNQQSTQRRQLQRPPPTYRTTPVIRDYSQEAARPRVGGSKKNFVIKDFDEESLSEHGVATTILPQLPELRKGAEGLGFDGRYGA